MKNKEIEELLNNFQEVLDNPTTTDECYDGRIIEIDRSYDLEQDEIKLLLSCIKQLKNRNKELYEGFMATQEELTDYATKNEQLEKENKELKDRNEINIDRNIEAYKIVEQLENNRDKAIEYIENMPYLQETDKEYEDMNGNIYFTYKEWDDSELLNILKGDSDE